MTDKLTEYTFILPDGSKRYEFVANMKALRAFMKMHGAKSAAPTAGQCWAIFWTVNNGDNDLPDYYVIEESEADARARLAKVIDETENLHCAGCGPIMESTEHWHCPPG
jgi:hypothetical protein